MQVPLDCCRLSLHGSSCGHYRNKYKLMQQTQLVKVADVG